MVRGSLGSIKLLGDGAVSHRYPMYAISVPNLLKLEKWEPHQDLLKAELLTEIKSSMDVEVLFISHQWTSFTHPDPTGEQLSALQAVITKLLEGKTSVRSNAILEGIYNSKTVITGAEWVTRLPNMYVWLDYFSIPQPGASPHMKQTVDTATRKMSTTDHRQLFADGAEVKLDADGDGQITMAELIEGLKNAVDSIPSYIERSSMTWVLVPPIPHTDLPDAVCDFNSWRCRGWCRMEVRHPPRVVASPRFLVLASIRLLNQTSPDRLGTSHSSERPSSPRGRTCRSWSSRAQAASPYFSTPATPSSCAPRTATSR